MAKVHEAILIKFLTQSPRWFLVLAGAQVPSRAPADVLQYACGLKLGSALTLEQNPNFEMASYQSDSICNLSDFI